MMRRKGIKQSSYGCVDKDTYKELCSLYAKSELVMVAELYSELKIKKQTGNKILSNMGIVRPKRGWVTADDADKIRLHCKCL